jgi:hypothetical protein
VHPNLADLLRPSSKVLDLSLSKSAEATPREGSSPSFGTPRKTPDSRSASNATESPPQAFGANFGAEAVEASIAAALTEAAKAGRFDVVAQLARELEARRLASATNVVPLPKRSRGT